MWWHPGSGGSLELLRLASSTSDLIQDVMPLVPDLLVGELEHDEASSAQPLHARGIELLVDEAGVEALALDLDDQRKIGSPEVDPTNPAVHTPTVDLGPPRGFPGRTGELLA